MAPFNGNRGTRPERVPTTDLDSLRRPIPVSDEAESTPAGIRDGTR